MHIGVASTLLLITQTPPWLQKAHKKLLSLIHTCFIFHRTCEASWFKKDNFYSQDQWHPSEHRQYATFRLVERPIAWWSPLGFSTVHESYCTVINDFRSQQFVLPSCSKDYRYCISLHRSMMCDRHNWRLCRRFTLQYWVCMARASILHQSSLFIFLRSTTIFAGKRRIVMVLHGIVWPSWKHPGDLTPTVAPYFLLTQNNPVLLFGPIPLANFRAQVIQPPFATLFSGSPW